MIVIFAFSHQPYSGRETEKYLGGYNVPVRKLGHITEYMILFWLIRLAIAGPSRVEDEEKVSDTISSVARSIPVSPHWQLTSLSCLLAILYAASDEWHQSFVPGRSSNWNDVAVDACGIALGLTIWMLWIAVRNRIDIVNTTTN